jgi:hypothetical protein
MLEGTMYRLMRRLNRFTEEAGSLVQAGNHTPPQTNFEPSVLDDREVRRLVQCIADSGDYAAMPLLGDALEEAGCTDTEAQDHCRRYNPSQGPSWVLDGLLHVYECVGESSGWEDMRKVVERCSSDGHFVVNPDGVCRPAAEWLFEYTTVMWIALNHGPDPRSEEERRPMDGRLGPRRTISY